MMIDARLHDVAKSIAARQLGARVVNDVLLEPVTDSDGRDALRLTIILNDGAIDDIEGGDLVDVLVELRRGLSEAGEHRIPVVYYAEVGDQVGDGDPQP